MELSENIAIKEIQEIFSSDNVNLIHDTISYIHENGSAKTMPLLFDLLANTNEESLKTDVYNCLCDAKDPQVIPVFIETLKDSRFVNEKAKILSVIWQTNLDFSAYSDFFLDILLHENYENALEAFTILEVFADKLPETVRKEYQNRILKAMQADKSEKANLLHEAYHLFE